MKKEDKDEKIITTVRLRRGLLAALSTVARAEGRSRHNLIEVTLEARCKRAGVATGEKGNVLD